jgi:hypothetical protein
LFDTVRANIAGVADYVWPISEQEFGWVRSACGLWLRADRSVLFERRGSLLAA